MGSRYCWSAPVYGVSVNR